MSHKTLPKFGSLCFALALAFAQFLPAQASVPSAGNASEAETAIHGRVLDANSGNPFPYIAVTLSRCNDQDCSAYVNSVYTDESGQFLFNSAYDGLPLSAGTYVVAVFADRYGTQRIPVTLAQGENLDLGDILMQPLPLIGSIRGRVVDAVTGNGIDPAFTPLVYLYRCEGVDYCLPSGSAAPDGEGYFRFDTDGYGNRLTVGDYQISAEASQYGFSSYIDIPNVSENEDRLVPEIRLRSARVRFSEAQPCPAISASGGVCAFSVRIWNGAAQALSGKIWSTVYVHLPGPLGEGFNIYTGQFTDFQIKDPQDINLGPGASGVYSFQATIPANTVADGTTICTDVFVGEDPKAYYRPIGQKYISCAPGGDASERNATAELLSQPSMTTATEVEPNQPCQAAQDLGDASAGYVIDGLLDSSTEPDIDFFRFTGTPGALYTVDHEGQSTGKGTLEDPVLGVFDSSCSLLIAFNDNSFNLDSHVQEVVPEDGVFIVAATAYPDYDFVGGGNGSYQLTVTVSPVQYIDSIDGTVVSAVTGQPLSGVSAPYANVTLFKCEASGCNYVTGQSVGSDGSFRFETDRYGRLRTGDYVVSAEADHYQGAGTQGFTVGEAESYHVGRLALSPNPIWFDDPHMCIVPSAGGMCEFSVKITNGSAARLSGKAWSMITGWDLRGGSLTSFQADSMPAIGLAPGKSTVLQFRFYVPGSVPDGAFFLAEVFVGKNPNPLFNPLGVEFVCCLTKGSTVSTSLSEMEMHALLQKLQILEVAPAHAPSLNKP